MTPRTARRHLTDARLNLRVWLASGWVSLLTVRPRERQGVRR